MKYLSIIVGFIFIFSAVSVSVVNTENVTLFLPFSSFNLIMPLYVVILSVAVFSFMLGVIFMFFHTFTVNLAKRRKLKEELKQAEAKVDK